MRINTIHHLRLNGSVRHQLITLINRYNMSLHRILRNRTIITRRNRQIKAVREQVIGTNLPYNFNSFLHTRLNLRVRMRNIQKLFHHHMRIRMSRVLTTMITRHFNSTQRHPMQITIRMHIRTSTFISNNRRYRQLRNKTSFMHYLNSIIRLLNRMIISYMRQSSKAILKIRQRHTRLRAIKRSTLRTILKKASNKRRRILLQFIGNNSSFMTTNFRILLTRHLNISRFILRRHRRMSIQSKRLIILLSFSNLQRFHNFLLIQHSMTIFIRSIRRTLMAFFDLLKVRIKNPCTQHKGSTNGRNHFKRHRVLHILTRMHFNHYLSTMYTATRVSNIRMITRRLTLILYLNSFSHRRHLARFTRMQNNFTRVVTFHVLLNSNKATLPTANNRIIMRHTYSTSQVSTLVNVRKTIFQDRGHITSMIKRIYTTSSFTVLLHVTTSQHNTIIMVRNHLFDRHRLFQLQSFHNNMRMNRRTSAYHSRHHRSTRRPFRRRVLIFSNLFKYTVQDILQPLKQLTRRFSVSPMNNTRP